jgi:PGF-pre-PGF domain-containing protein
VRRVTVVPREDAKNVRVSVEVLTGPPAGVPPLQGLGVYAYLEISTSLPDELIQKAIIEFEVPRKWMETHGVKGVGLCHYKGGWEMLQTTEIGGDERCVLFSATSSGFSTYAITYVSAETVYEGGTVSPENATADDGNYENIYETDYGTAGNPAYRENVQENITGISAGTCYTLEIEYYISGDSENVSVFLYNFSTGAWDNRGLLDNHAADAASPALFTYEFSGLSSSDNYIYEENAYVRLVQPDDDSTQTSLMVDFIRVVSHDWEPLESWGGGVGAPAGWVGLESMAGAVQAPASWREVEGLTCTLQAAVTGWTEVEFSIGTVGTQAGWAGVEGWSGAPQAQAVWQSVESLTGTVGSVVQWLTLEGWSGAVQTLASWVLADSWGGTVGAPAGSVWVEGWSGTVQMPALWSALEGWTGAIRAPAEWLAVDSCAGMVQTPASWKEVEGWAGTTCSTAEWSSIDSWTESTGAPGGWVGLESMGGEVQAPASWREVEGLTCTLQAAVTGWTEVEFWTGSAETSAGWEGVEGWSGTVEAPMQWRKIEEWSMSVRAQATWLSLESYAETLANLTQWLTVEGCSEGIRTLVSWGFTDFWTETARAMVSWQTADTLYTGTISLPAEWHVLDSWTGCIQTLTSWPTLEGWTETAQALAQWIDVEPWDETTHFPAQWSTLESLQGTIWAQAVWKSIEGLMADISTAGYYTLIESTEATALTSPEWRRVERLQDMAVASVSWQQIESQAGTIRTPTWLSTDSWAATLGSPTPSPPPTPPRATVLEVDPSSFELSSGGSITLTAKLKDDLGNPLAGRTVSWREEGGRGNFSQTSGSTDENGQVRVVYTAPEVAQPEGVRIIASFAGGAGYSGSSGSSTGRILPAPPIPTSIILSPSTFRVASGESLPLNLKLVDENGLPVPGKSISLSASAGQVSPPAGLTDEHGELKALYLSPTVEAPTPVTIKASFEGDNRYGASSATSAGEVVPLETMVRLKYLLYALENRASELGLTLENKNLQVLENSFIEGRLGMSISIRMVLAPSTTTEYLHPDLKPPEVRVTAGERIDVVVESSTKAGKTILLNLDNRVLPAPPEKIEVLFDGKKIQLADDYTDVLDPTDENLPEYLVLTGRRGVQILVSIPFFSKHTITIRGPVGVPWAILLTAVVFVVILILLLTWRRARIPTSIILSPSTFRVASGESLPLNLKLVDENGLPVPGKSISLSASAGQVSPPAGLTDEHGELKALYLSPTVEAPTPVTIKASFEGDNRYGASSATSAGEVVPTPPRATVLEVDPSSFELSSGGSITLTAKLKDDLGNPLAGRTVSWREEGGRGNFSQTSGSTDENGQVRVVYTAPEVARPEGVRIIASFAGGAGYSGSSGSSTGRILPISG